MTFTRSPLKLLRAESVESPKEDFSLLDPQARALAKERLTQLLWDEEWKLGNIEKEIKSIKATLKALKEAEYRPAASPAEIQWDKVLQLDADPGRTSANEAQVVALTRLKGYVAIRGTGYINRPVRERLQGVGDQVRLTVALVKNWPEMTAKALAALELLLPFVRNTSEYGPGGIWVNVKIVRLATRASYNGSTYLAISEERGLYEIRQGDGRKAKVLRNAQSLAALFELISTEFFNIEYCELAGYTEAWSYT